MRLTNCTSSHLQIRNTGMVIVSFSFDTTLFVFMKFFPILLEIIDLHGCLIIFGICCLIGSSFMALVLKETSGQSLDDIAFDEKTQV